MIGRLRIGLAVLVVLIVIWLGWGLFTAVGDIRNALTNDAHDFRDNSEFYLSQYERELARLIVAIQEYHAGNQSISHENLIHHLDIFWSRVNVYDQGAMGQYITSISDDYDLKEDSLSVLVQTEEALLTGQQRDPAAGLVIIEPLQKLLGRYHDVILAVNGTTVSYKSRNRDFLNAWLEQSVYLLVGLSTAIGLLIMFLYIDLLATSRQVRALRRAQQSAEDANKAKSEFLSSMSHEIRTPMTGVIGFADLLMDDNLSDSSREKVIGIKRATSSLLRLINDILDMSRLEAGKMEIEHIDFNLENWMQDILALFGNATRGQSSVALDVEMATNLPVGVHSDPTRLRQVLVNIIGNAVKFTENGRVIIRCRRHQAANGWKGLRFEIEDTGIGMSPETMKGLFSEFVQADASISRLYEGSGLGLAICKRVVELMGGEIGVESEKGKGSLFWFHIPCRYLENMRPAVEQNSQVNNKTRAKRSLKILVAEDNRVNQVILVKFLEAWGHRVKLAWNGVEAVELASSELFDLILMDIRMPEMNGMEATRRIRNLDCENASVPIIAVTADAMADQLVQYEKAGMNDCVTKPIERPRLAASIDKALNSDIHEFLHQAVNE